MLRKTPKLVSLNLVFLVRNGRVDTDLRLGQWMRVEVNSSLRMTLIV